MNLSVTRCQRKKRTKTLVTNQNIGKKGEENGNNFCTEIIIMLGVIAYRISKIKVEHPQNELTVKDLLELSKFSCEVEKLKKKHKEEKPTEEKPKEEKEEKPQKAEPPSLYGEIWKPLVEPIPVKDNSILPYYMVSNMGRVWNDKLGVLLNEKMMPTGLIVNLNRKEKGSSQRFVRNLVATAFIGAQNTYIYKVVHCDGNPRNCAATNLRWTKIKKGGNHRG